MKNCIFCKLANKEIPTNIIYENKNFVAFLDANPVSKGHCLVVPKKHMKNILDADDKAIKEGFLIASKIAKFLKKKFKCEGVNILTNANARAGQTVMHFHIHIIPRYKNKDGLSIEFKEISSFNTNKIKDEFKSLK